MTCPAELCSWRLSRPPPLSMLIVYMRNINPNNEVPYQHFALAMVGLNADVNDETATQGMSGRASSSPDSLGRFESRRLRQYGGGEAGLTKNLFQIPKINPRQSNPPPHPIQPS
jgi:hypothetical protein